MTIVLFLCAVILHNLEECIWFPKWSQMKGRWRKPVGHLQFLFAATIITLLALFSGLAAAFAPSGTIALYVFTGFALAMGLNAIMPHLVLTIMTRSYMPGTLTGLLLVLPASVFTVQSALSTNKIDFDRFLLVGPLVVIALLILLPILFWVGNRIAKQG